MAGGSGPAERAFASACHGAGRRMSRHQALKRWRGRQLVDELAARGILIRSPSLRGVAEEAPGAYKDVAWWTPRPLQVSPAKSLPYRRSSTARADAGFASSRCP